MTRSVGQRTPPTCPLAVCDGPDVILGKGISMRVTFKMQTYCRALSKHWAQSETKRDTTQGPTIAIMGTARVRCREQEAGQVCSVRRCLQSTLTTWRGTTSAAEGGQRTRMARVAWSGRAGLRRARGGWRGGEARAVTDGGRGEGTTTTAPARPALTSTTHATHL